MDSETCIKGNCSARPPARPQPRRPARAVRQRQHRQGGQGNPQATTTPATPQPMLSAAPDHCFGKRGGRTMLTPLEIATGYLARGWNPVPVRYRKKNPIENGWQKLIITESNIATYFNGA